MCIGMKGMMTSMWWWREGMTVVVCVPYQQMTEKPSDGGVEGGSKK
jgi:hypothetical protein